MFDESCCDSTHRAEEKDKESVAIEKLNDETKQILQALGTEAAKEGTRGVLGEPSLSDLPSHPQWESPCMGPIF